VHRCHFWPVPKEGQTQPDKDGASKEKLEYRDSPRALWKSSFDFTQNREEQRIFIPAGLLQKFLKCKSAILCTAGVD
jgi:hypothetical protein